MKVFVLIAGEYDDEYTIGVFSSIEKSKKYIEDHPDCLCVESEKCYTVEYELDKGIQYESLTTITCFV